MLINCTHSEGDKCLISEGLYHISIQEEISKMTFKTQQVQQKQKKNEKIHTFNAAENVTVASEDEFYLCVVVECWLKNINTLPEK